MRMNKILLIVVMGLAVIGALLTVLEIWGIGLGGDVYIKLMVTFGVIGALCAFVMVLKADLGDHKKLKDGNYLD